MKNLYIESEGYHMPYTPIVPVCRLSIKARNINSLPDID
jgi:hypothetical protein